ncbi:hypothetical protein VT84_36910 [Gemmata sp. SH-PL17]|uniref:hypothetical protein n=1 Tax=Gemmata sp. SH-PL17 TaxID=1630693 RepID=UPI00078E04B5|nr:hypothetical protein [Gemmata sp. SH-PL17]AMV30033.1 hypothetical protein VT84_36910 [Gemmata sp. SH-PL17]
MVEVEVWVMVDENGDYEVSKDADDLQPTAGLAARMVKITVNVPTPKAVELVATVAEEPATAELKVA